jgi:hypothetical protein
MKSSHLVTLLLVAASLTACGENPPSPIDAPKPSTASDIAPAADAVPPPTPIDTLIKNVVADGVPFQPEAAKVEGNALVSTGAPGYVMFGPYLPFVAGKYRVTVRGSIPNLTNGAQVRFDAVSAGASSVHGEQIVTTAVPAAGTIAQFDVTIPEGVMDLELRAETTGGAEVRIESYEVVKAD